MADRKQAVRWSSSTLSNRLPLTPLTFAALLRGVQLVRFFSDGTLPFRFVSASIALIDPIRTLEAAVTGAKSCKKAALKFRNGRIKNPGRSARN